MNKYLPSKKFIVILSILIVLSLFFLIISYQSAGKVNFKKKNPSTKSTNGNRSENLPR